MMVILLMSLFLVSFYKTSDVFLTSTLTVLSSSSSFSKVFLRAAS